MERLVVCNQLIRSVTNRMDPLQFAYRAKRGVQDAKLALFNLTEILRNRSKYRSSTRMRPFPNSVFSIYTNDISCNNSFLTLTKHVDDMAIVGRLKNEFSLSEYLLQNDALPFQFTSISLKLNTTTIIELMFRGERINQTSKPIFIGNQEVEIVKSFKYLKVLYLMKAGHSVVMFSREPANDFSY